ncbi:F0F1 ATP synthase subunit delta [Parazoarcus communis]|jgi:F-type H+-transporting ATPase subunit delta|uniref:ATP synthase subunit delta n=1 Tax=Parazoarcus communis TaxID=41977 RepID=A0A2U8GT04_9RHOO|nr:F0F1 ATP synthase subunit delta [Parazoarcus communis]AWI76373.1 F0F1 ATP synthase subunit delta [Parazoarcus communis]AWI79043.1 F0F1 ATP synthase subunit delta [Parazoarcus communis]PLX74409.1 MAG: F0F1 ATP synthase subunit delta [Azoarcus sp.]TVT60344.1 MAG: F0F1 ATP synthase subunit delta [Azoarcus sp. PHD]|tara:strand:- start:94257 stop:94790 length:534 start_codon:yes stop_codon:yes gene_type:complete
MAENVTIARPYADAAFELARGAGALGPWSEVLDRLASVAADSEMLALFNDPKFSGEQLNKLMLEVAGDLSAEQQNFIRVLVEGERLQVLPEIRDLFVALKNEHEGVLEAKIASAFPLDDAALASLKADLEARFKTKLDVSVSIDPELIGGVRIAIGDEVIDASVRGKLANMAAALKN